MSFQLEIKKITNTFKQDKELNDFIDSRESYTSSMTSVIKAQKTFIECVKVWGETETGPVKELAEKVVKTGMENNTAREPLTESRKNSNKKIKSIFPERDKLKALQDRNKECLDAVASIEKAIKKSREKLKKTQGDKEIEDNITSFEKELEKKKLECEKYAKKLERATAIYENFKTRVVKEAFTEYMLAVKEYHIQQAEILKKTLESFASLPDVAPAINDVEEKKEEVEEKKEEKN